MEVCYLGPRTGPVLAVYRFGSNFVNWYIVETTSGLLIVDTGFAGHIKQLKKFLDTKKYQSSFVKGILLTHSHPDHIGFAQRAHKFTNAPVYLHEREVEASKNGKVELPILDIVLRPRVFYFFLRAILFEHALGFEPLKNPIASTDYQVLSLPGKPQVLHTPGHTPGHCAFLFEENQLLFVGDSLGTSSPLRDEPIFPNLLTTVNADNALAAESLKKYEPLDYPVLIFPGHGNIMYTKPRRLLMELKSLNNRHESFLYGKESF